MTRIYKYALHPTPMQRKCLEECGSTSRFLWNRMVGKVRYVLHEINHGRRGTIENEYRKLLSEKSLVGMRAKAIAGLAIEKGISKDDALRIFIEEKTKKDTTIVTRKNGTKAKKWSANHLAWKYAVEKVNSERLKLVSPDVLVLWTGIQAKWINFGNSWDGGIFKSPRFKKYGEISAIQKQIGPMSSWNFGQTVDLSWCGSPCLTNVDVNVHRKIPSGSTIKQIALVKETNGEWFLCIFLNADNSVFQRHFNQCDSQVVGIDPGVKAALTTSDGQIFEPNSLTKQSRVEKKLKKLLRKLQRQTQACNPHCFNADQTWRRGQRITVRSKGMLETASQITRIKKYFRDAKNNYYHNTAIQLLNSYDTIAIGDVKLHALISGKGNAKRALNTRVREHAISDFKSKIKDKASLSLTPKYVCDIVETNTTRTCNVCKFINKTLTLDDRKWTCPQCNTHHDRDVNAAINIKISAMKAAGSQSVSEEKSSKVRRSTKVTKTRSTETTKSQDGRLTQEVVASVQVTPHLIESASTTQPVVVEQDVKTSVSTDTGSPMKILGHSQNQPCITDTEQLKA